MNSFARTMKTSLAVAFALAATAVAAEEKWETIQTSPLVIKTRPKAGTSVKEVWAEGEIDAPVRDIQDTLMTPERFIHFMPYVKECRRIGKEEDGSEYVYTYLHLPVVSNRDYVLRVYLDKGVNPDGSGDFAEHWYAVPGKIPEKSGVVRLKISEGSWHVTPKPNGKSHAVYKFAADPGGMIPSFAANMGSTDGVLDTYKAVEREAKRRLAERKKQEAAAATPLANPGTNGASP